MLDAGGLAGVAMEHYGKNKSFLCPFWAILHAKTESKVIAFGRVRAVVWAVPAAAARPRRVWVSASLILRLQHILQSVNLRRGLRSSMCRWAVVCRRRDSCSGEFSRPAGRLSTANLNALSGTPHSPAMRRQRERSPSPESSFVPRSS